MLVASNFHELKKEKGKFNVRKKTNNKIRFKTCFVRELGLRTHLAR